MVDKFNRLVLGMDLIEESSYLHKNQEVNLFFDYEKSRILIMPKDTKSVKGLYKIGKKQKIDEKYRIYVPRTLREAFPNSTYLPGEQDGKMYILIINSALNSEKPE